MADVVLAVPQISRIYRSGQQEQSHDSLRSRFILRRQVGKDILGKNISTIFAFFIMSNTQRQFPIKVDNKKKELMDTELRKYIFYLWL